MLKKKNPKVGLVSFFSVLAVVFASMASLTTLPRLSIASSNNPGINQGNEPSAQGVGIVDVYWIPVMSGLPTGSEYYGVYFGDVNNDGKLDVAAQAGGWMRAYVGDGLGNFVEESNGLPAGGNTVDLVLADFNNDGNLDIAGSALYLGNGGAGGSMLWTADTSPGFWNAATAADVNLDGNMDIVAGTGSGVYAWTGDGGAGGSLDWTGSSTGLPLSGNYWGVKVGDINHDGKPDIVCAENGSGIRAWTGNGLTGPASLWTDNSTGLPALDSYSGVDLGDMNNDGNLDVVSSAYYSGNGIRAWLGNGGAGGSMVFTENSFGLDTGTNAYLGVLLQDVNNDGNLDIIAAHYQGGGVRIWLGDGGAGGIMDWTEDSTGLPNGNYIDLDGGDYNNDGKMDFVVSYNSGVQVWENERPDFVITGYTSISTGLPITNTWYDVIFGDIDNDGKLDLAASSASGQGVRVWTGDGTGMWTPTVSQPATTGNYNGMRFADVDHNGKLDLIAGMNGGGGTAVKVWTGDGAGSWTETSITSPFPIGGGIEVVDVNHDGNDDIITCDFNANRYVYVFLGDGAGNWGMDTGPSEQNGYDDVALGDVNHDGDLDLISTSMAGAVETRFWLGDGTGTGWTIQSPGIPTTGVYLGAALADVNHDGNLDAGLAGFAGNSMMKVYTSDGGAGGTIDWTDESSGLPTVNGYAGIEFGDLDLDGNPDIVYSNRTGGIEVRKGNGGAGGSMLWTDAWLPNLPTVGNYWGIALGDVNNDGKLEIGATRDGSVEVWRIETTTTYQPPELLGGQVVPANGNVGDIYTFNVTYRDVNNDTPLPAPYVWINKSGLPYGSSPYLMILQNWIGALGNYSAGGNYSYSTTLTDCGSDYSFVFNASDGFFNTFSGESPGHIVNCKPEVQYLGVQGYLAGTTGIGHITDHTSLFNWTYYDPDGTPQNTYNVTVWDDTITTLLWYNNTTSAITTDTYNGTGTAIADLVDGNNYWLRISVYDGSEWSDWNETQFHMNTLPPTAVEPITPPDDSLLPFGPSQSVSWILGGADAEGDTITYYWYVDIDNPPIAPYVSDGSTSGTLSTPFATNPSTDYYWYVNATDGWEWNLTVLWNFTTSAIPNNPPEAQSLTVQGFAQGTAGILNITDHTPELAWTFSDDDGDPQTQYEVRIGTAAGLADIWAPGIQIGAAITVTYDFDSTALPLIDGTDYWFGVRVYDGAGWSSWNETRFHMNSLPPSPTIPSPTDGSVGLAPGVQTIGWNIVTDPEGSSLTYYWYVSTDVSFTILYDSNTTITTSANVITSQATTFYWRVQTYDGYEFGSNSTTWNFTTNRAPILDWTGENNYENDGVNPDTGDTTTYFEFRVEYTDEDNHSGTVRLVIFEDGTELLNETMVEVNPSDLDYKDGKLYMRNVQLSAGAYSYHFYATDTIGAIAVTIERSLVVSNETGGIEGSVVTEDGAPIQNARVELVMDEQVVKTTDTDSEGNFEFSNNEFGNYNIKISMEDYYDQVIPVNLNQPLLELGPVLLVKREQPSHFPWWIIILIIIVVVVILLIFLLLKRRKKKDQIVTPAVLPPPSPPHSGNEPPKIDQINRRL